MGSLREHVCETLRDLRGVFCSQSAGYGWAEHMCSRGEPLGLRGFFFLCAGDVMAARAVGIRQEGVNPCRMVPSKRDEVQCSCMTSRARSSGCELPCKDARWASCRAGDAHKFKINRINLERRKSKPRFRVNMISRGRGEIPPVFLGTGLPLVRGMG